ncbi:MAG: hypothetical protein Q7U60_12750 [Candidatus Methanoperedens sp.]|nr:hypothetical protein [Candidatus Methanoperedens sp.]
MITKKMKLALAFLGVFILLNVPIPTIFIAIFLGLLLIPVVVFASVLITGIPVIIKELQAIIESGEEIFVITLSKDSIILEPNLKDNF